jgi:hypothetical protein
MKSAKLAPNVPLLKIKLLASGEIESIMFRNLVWSQLGRFARGGLP